MVKPRCRQFRSRSRWLLQLLLRSRLFLSWCRPRLVSRLSTLRSLLLPSPSSLLSISWDPMVSCNR